MKSRSSLTYFCIFEHRPVARNEKLIEIACSYHIDDTFITAFMAQIEVIRYRLSHNLYSSTMNSLMYNIKSYAVLAIMPRG